MDFFFFPFCQPIVSIAVLFLFSRFFPFLVTPSHGPLFCFPLFSLLSLWFTAPRYEVHALPVFTFHPLPSVTYSFSSPSAGALPSPSRPGAPALVAHQRPLAAPPSGHPSPYRSVILWSVGRRIRTICEPTRPTRPRPHHTLGC